MREMLWMNGKQGDSGIGKWVSCRFNPSGKGGFDLGNENGSAALSNWPPLLYSLPAGVVPTSQVAMAISVCASRGWECLPDSVFDVWPWWTKRPSSALSPDGQGGGLQFWLQHLRLATPVLKKGSTSRTRPSTMPTIFWLDAPLALHSSTAELGVGGRHWDGAMLPA